MPSGVSGCAAAGAAAVVSYAGLLGFVGLVVPHIARRLVGVDHRVLLPACALLGAIFLLVCDTAARTLFAPTELNISSVTAVFGAPVVIALMVSRKNRRFQGV